MGAVIITFNEYLENLRKLENTKPEGERREVPTVRQIALSTGMKKTTANTLMKGRVNAVNLNKLALIIDDMKSRGFNTKITDFLAYVSGGQLAEM